ncbi:Ciao3 [Symbiodinium sp. CCMP2456]|nr:Ciao3 [Symbiodinium sp. CCMP2456]
MESWDFWVGFSIWAASVRTGRVSARFGALCAQAKLGNVSEARSLPVAEVPQVKKPNLIKSKQSGSDPKAQIGQVTLSDCLACSGCVTSAETVLLQEQSGDEFLKRAETSPLTVVSISAEARTSIAAHNGEGPLLTLRRIGEGLRRLGADLVLEASAAEAVALLEGQAEFTQRFRSAVGGSTGSRNGSNGFSRSGGKSTAGKLPLLTSHCPGWTLYAEKVVDPVVLPHLTPVRPPQHVQGRLVKTALLEAVNRRRFYRWWRARSPFFAAGYWIQSLLKEEEPPVLLKPSDVYHVFVQPCYDRKIEAARPSFEVPGVSGVKEVDTVLTASELLSLLRNAGDGCCGSCGVHACEKTELSKIPPCPLQSEVLTDVFLGSLEARVSPLICAVRNNAGSGGFLEHVFREAARELFHLDLPSAPLALQTKQNEDMREVILRDPQSQEVLLRFTAAYGFRNIQNVIRRITKGSSGDGKDIGHFVEIMACPGGCLNGGGQIAPEKKPVEEDPDTKASSQVVRRQRLQNLEQTLAEGDGTAYVHPSEHPLVLPIYRYIVSQASGFPVSTAEPTSSSRVPRGSELRCFFRFRAVRLNPRPAHKCFA